MPVQFVFNMYWEVNKNHFFRNRVFLPFFGKWLFLGAVLDVVFVLNMETDCFQICYCLWNKCKKLHVLIFNWNVNCPLQDVLSCLARKWTNLFGCSHFHSNAMFMCKIAEYLSSSRIAKLFKKRISFRVCLCIFSRAHKTVSHYCFFPCVI